MEDDSDSDRNPGHEASGHRSPLPSSKALLGDGRLARLGQVQKAEPIVNRKAEVELRVVGPLRKRYLEYPVKQKKFRWNTFTGQIAGQEADRSLSVEIYKRVKEDQAKMIDHVRSLSQQQPNRNLLAVKSATRPFEGIDFSSKVFRSVDNSSIRPKSINKSTINKQEMQKYPTIFRLERKINVSKIKFQESEQSKESSSNRFKTLLPQIIKNSERKEDDKTPFKRKVYDRSKFPLKEADPGNYMKSKNYYIRDIFNFYIQGGAPQEPHARRVRQHVEEMARVFGEQKNYIMEQTDDSDARLPVEAPQVAFSKPVLVIDIDETLLFTESSEEYSQLHDAVLKYAEKIDGIKITKKIYVRVSDPGKGPLAAAHARLSQSGGKDVRHRAVHGRREAVRRGHAPARRPRRLARQGATAQRSLLQGQRKGNRTLYQAYCQRSTNHQGSRTQGYSHCG